MSEPVENVEIENPVLGKLKLSGASLNNLFTVFTFVVACFIGWTIYAHAEDTKKNGIELVRDLRDTNKEVAAALKESNKEMAKVLQEMARATREQNCLLSLPIAERSTNRNAETCRRIAQ